MPNTQHPTRRYTDLIADTVLEHGYGWTARYYRSRLPRWMADILLAHPDVRRAVRARAAYIAATAATAE